MADFEKESYSKSDKLTFQYNFGMFFYTSNIKSYATGRPSKMIRISCNTIYVHIYPSLCTQTADSNHCYAY